MNRMNRLDQLFVVLLVIGGLNWGLVGLLGVNLVSSLFGSMTFTSRLIYSGVGIAALYTLVSLLARRDERIES